MKAESERAGILVIISDTPMSFEFVGQPKVFEPTLREVEYLTGLFDRIVWFGMPVLGKVPEMYRAPKSDKIQLHQFIRTIGGETMFHKINTIPRLPVLCFQVARLIWKYDYIHTRGPSLPAWIAILLSSFFKRKKFWHKYAGNWNQTDPPFSYGAQRFLLQHSLHPVTVNGHWNEPNRRILAFENPCFSEEELEDASRVIKKFDTDEKEILFAGRLEEEKGVFAILNAASQLPSTLTWHIVGSGKDEKRVREMASTHMHVNVYSGMNRHELNQFYRRSHFLVLPTTASEGFPKVVAEACGFGCIPIVSGISSIRHYLSDDFAFILSDVTGEGVVNAITALSSDKTLEAKSAKAMRFARMFSYEKYIHRVGEEVFRLGSRDSQ